MYVYIYIAGIGVARQFLRRHIYICVYVYVCMYACMFVYILYIYNIFIYVYVNTCIYKLDVEICGRCGGGRASA